MSEKNDLDILIPDNEIKLASGETIVIKPFSFAKLPKVVALINSIGVGIFTLMEAGKGVTVTNDDKAVSVEADNEGAEILEIDDLVISKANDFITAHFEEIVEILTIYCRRPKEFFLDENNGPDVEEVCQIILLIVGRHLSFFTKTLAPLMANISNKTTK